MIRALLYRLSNHLPCRIISDGTRPYLERYYLFTLLGVRAYLHRFVGSDPDRGLHDHPWQWAVSFILCGWYIEETRADPAGAPVRWFNFLLGDSFHRVVLDSPEPVWTLFLHRVGDVKPWGFINTGTVAVPFPDRIVWNRFHYSGGKDRNWWKSAPRGKDCEGRQP